MIATIKTLNLKFIQPSKTQRNVVLFGKNKSIRFKTKLIQDLGWENSYIKVGIQIENEKEIKTALYLAKGDETNGFKLQFQNKSYSISGATILEKLELIGEVPFRVAIEFVEYNETKFVKLDLSNVQEGK
jgi:hypothetical protein